MEKKKPNSYTLKAYGRDNSALAAMSSLPGNATGRKTSMKKSAKIISKKATLGVMKRGGRHQHQQQARPKAEVKYEKSQPLNYNNSSNDDVDDNRRRIPP